MADKRVNAQDDRPSEELLNAFVDGEFSPEDRLETLKRISCSEHLSREVCDMHQLKELVNMAYRDVRSPRDGGRPGPSGRRSWFPSVAAGMLALVLGSLAGFELTRDADFLAGAPATDDAAATLADGNGLSEAAVSQPVAAADADNVLLHVNEADATAMAELLDDIEAMYREAEAAGRDLNVQVVVHNSAMDMLRADRAPHPERVAALTLDHPSLRFTACAQTLEQLARAEGGSIEILPQAERVDSGVAEAARRQSEGWIYIKV